MKNEGQRRLVLTEEDYTAKLSSIVARDFFPDVSKLERQNALLDRRLEGDVVGAIAVRRASRRLMEDEENAASRREQDDLDLVESGTGAAAASIQRVDNDPATYTKRPIRKRPRPLEEETISGFVARATNEDDHEFDSNLKRDLRENRQRIGQFYESNKNSSSGNTESINNSLRLEMASDDFAPESTRIEWKKPTARNGLFFNPTPMTNPSHTNHSANENNKGLIEGSIASSAEERSLMPPPSKQQTSGMLSTRTLGKKNNTHLPKSELIEYIPQHTLVKKVQPSATRFPSKESFGSNIATSGNGILQEEIDSASDTDYMSSASEVSTDLDGPLRSVEEERRRYQSKKQSERRSYVAMTPQIIPGAGNESPITTWGCIDGTPIVLSGHEDRIEPPSSSSFRILGESERESAANKADLLMAQRVKRASSSSSSSSSRSKKRSSGLHAKRSDSLTPAAMSLLERTKSTRSRSDGAFVSGLRKSYTPRHHPSSSTASRKHSARSSKRRRDHAYNATPQT